MMSADMAFGSRGRRTRRPIPSGFAELHAKRNPCSSIHFLAETLAFSRIAAGGFSAERRADHNRAPRITGLVLGDLPSGRVTQNSSDRPTAPGDPQLPDRSIVC